MQFYIKFKLNLARGRASENTKQKLYMTALRLFIIYNYNGNAIAQCAECWSVPVLRVEPTKQFVWFLIRANIKSEFQWIQISLIGAVACVPFGGLNLRKEPNGNTALEDRWWSLGSSG